MEHKQNSVTGFAHQQIPLSFRAHYPDEIIRQYLAYKQDIVRQQYRLQQECRLHLYRMNQQKQLQEYHLNK